MHGVRRRRIDHRHDDVSGGAVAGRIDGLEVQRTGGRAVEGHRELPVVDVDGLAVEAQLAVRPRPSADGDRLVDRHRVERRRELEGGGDAVDGVGPVEHGVGQEHPPDRQRDRVLAFVERAARTSSSDTRSAGVMRSSSPAELEVVEQLDAVERDRCPEPVVCLGQHDRDGEVLGVVGGERAHRRRDRPARHGPGWPSRTTSRARGRRPSAAAPIKRNPRSSRRRDRKRGARPRSSRSPRGRHVDVRRARRCPQARARGG